VDIVHVQFSIDDRTLGDEIASALLNAHLVACVQTVGPVASRYWWQGSITDTQEWLFVCKTTRDRAAEVVEFVRGRHPYEVPEIVGYDVAGNESYAAWVAAETRRTPPGRGDI
jgi:periplasmic divalent cation tolerance protein